MPQGVDEIRWKKAKTIAEKSDTAPEKGTDAWWAYVRGIYNRMGAGAVDKAAAAPAPRAFDSNAVISRLLSLKAASDRGNYGAKHEKFRRLLKERPEEFEVDSREGAAYGVTHKPSGFRFHVPVAEIPAQWRRSADALEKRASITSTNLFRDHAVTALRRVKALQRSTKTE